LGRLQNFFPPAYQSSPFPASVSPPKSRTSPPTFSKRMLFLPSSSPHDTVPLQREFPASHFPPIESDQIHPPYLHHSSPGGDIQSPPSLKGQVWTGALLPPSTTFFLSVFFFFFYTCFSYYFSFFLSPLMRGISDISEKFLPLYCLATGLLLRVLLLRKTTWVLLRCSRVLYCEVLLLGGGAVPEERPPKISCARASPSPPFCPIPKRFPQDFTFLSLILHFPLDE